ncbi:hypothetical protein SynA1560_01659 [Synechococcus sp. A15-60]|nr:hypothetical protein SynA1560_01659 [Synechococcus sp. A15-60]
MVVMIMVMLISTGGQNTIRTQGDSRACCKCNSTELGHQDTTHSHTMTTQRKVVIPR